MCIFKIYSNKMWQLTQAEGWDCGPPLSDFWDESTLYSIIFHWISLFPPSLQVKCLHLNDAQLCER